MPDDEPQRLSTLQATRLLDSAPEERFDRVTRLAQRVFGVPIALVSLVDAKRQWFKSKQGLSGTETSREISFCGHAILNDDPLVVEDAREDPRFFDNPLVTGDPRVRFYAGYPLAAPDGSKLGTLCIIGDQPRKFGAEDLMVMRTLATIIENELAASDRAANDPMTGLATMRGFLEIGDYTLRLSRKLGYTVELLVIQVTAIVQRDSGFAVADERPVLVSLARRLLTTFEHSDLVARIGPREFAVLIPRVGDQGVSHDQRLEELARQVAADAQSSRIGAMAHAALAYDAAKHRSLEALLSEVERRL